MLFRSLKLNNGAAYATSTAVTATIGLTDSVTTGYQMKIWGVAGAATESEAAWATFVKSKAITLTTGDGQKTVSIKVRDDVGNETATVTAKITLDTAVPVVTITGPDKSKISKVATFNVSAFSFSANVDFTEYKIKVVPSESSLENAESPQADSVTETTAPWQQAGRRRRQYPDRGCHAVWR